MEMQSQLKLELMYARTELAFLLSEQAPGQAREVRDARERVNELRVAIAMDAGDVARASLDLRGGHPL
jgi:hypothetical protein